jgi:lactate permease
VDIAAALVAMAALGALLRVWRPAAAAEPPNLKSQIPNRFRAWLPWLLLSVSVVVWKIKPVEQWLNDVAPWKMEVPALHLAVRKMPPVSAAPELEKAVYKFNLPAMTGSALLLSGIISGLLLGMRPVQMARLYARCAWRVRTSLLTIALMLALGYTTRYSGVDSTMGLVLAQTGWLFPFFSPMIGWLGVALTGSDTSSNVLFGNLQKVSAQQLGLSPILMASSNSTGGVMGKMIDAQSIVVASVATGGHPDSPDAGTVLRSVFWHSLALAILVGLLVMLQAYAVPWMVPE